ncbi:MAG: hypothetical protein JSS61_05930 [Verrucomicrobia bacterium]|nr:hypothetical protein [Verrucomicrobiota bacterium]
MTTVNICFTRILHLGDWIPFVSTGKNLFEIALRSCWRPNPSQLSSCTRTYHNHIQEKSFGYNLLLAIPVIGNFFAIKRDISLYYEPSITPRPRAERSRFGIEDMEGMGIYRCIGLFDEQTMTFEMRMKFLEKATRDYLSGRQDAESCVAGCHIQRMWRENDGRMCQFILENFKTAAEQGNERALDWLIDRICERNGDLLIWAMDLATHFDSPHHRTIWNKIAQIPDEVYASARITFYTQMSNRPDLPADLRSQVDYALGALFDHVSNPEKDSIIRHYENQTDPQKVYMAGLLCFRMRGNDAKLVACYEKAGEAGHSGACYYMAGRFRSEYWNKKRDETSHIPYDADPFGFRHYREERWGGGETQAEREEMIRGELREVVGEFGSRYELEAAFNRWLKDPNRDQAAETYYKVRALYGVMMGN